MCVCLYVYIRVWIHIYIYIGATFVPDSIFVEVYYVENVRLSCVDIRRCVCILKMCVWIYRYICIHGTYDRYYMRARVDLLLCVRLFYMNHCTWSIIYGQHQIRIVHTRPLPILPRSFWKSASLSPPTPRSIWMCWCSGRFAQLGLSCLLLTWSTMRVDIDLHIGSTNALNRLSLSPWRHFCHTSLGFDVQAVSPSWGFRPLPRLMRALRRSWATLFAWRMSRKSPKVSCKYIYI